MARIPFATRSYKSRSLPISAQRLVNWYAEQQPADAVSPITLMPTPGLVSWATVGSGPVKGCVTLDGLLYVVSGTGLYSVSSAGVATLLGSIVDVSRVSMASNGAEIFIATGSTGYTYDTTNGLVAITAAGYPNGNHAIFADGYFLTNEPGTGRFYHSSLYDGQTWDALDFATAEMHPDAVVGMIWDHRELWLLGESTTEIWTNTGGTFPFSRQTPIETGCGAKYSVAKTHNTVFWLGDDRLVYRIDAYTPVPISDDGMAAAIAGYSTVSDAYGWAHTYNGHVMYTITFPTEGATWVYDLKTGAWHERESYGETQYRANCYGYVYDKHLVGDYESGVIYELDPYTHTDAGGTLRRIATSPPITLEKWGMLQIEFEHGIGNTTDPGSDPTAALRWSDDAKTWSNSHNRTIGKIGEYQSRAVWRKLGQPKRRILGKPGWRIFEITVTDPIRWVVIDAHAE